MKYRVVKVQKAGDKYIISYKNTQIFGDRILLHNREKFIEVFNNDDNSLKIKYNLILWW